MLELRARAFGENAVAERMESLASGAVEVEAFDGKVLRSVPVDFHVRVLRKGQSAVRLKQFDMHGPLPIIAAPRIVAAWRIARHVDACARGEKICRSSRDRDNGHGVADP